MVLYLWLTLLNPKSQKKKANLMRKMYICKEEEWDRTVEITIGGIGHWGKMSGKVDFSCQSIQLITVKFAEGKSLLSSYSVKVHLIKPLWKMKTVCYGLRYRISYISFHSLIPSFYLMLLYVIPLNDYYFKGFLCSIG